MFHNFFEWVENPEKARDNAHTGWSSNQDLERDDDQYICILEFDNYQVAQRDEHHNYIMFEDEKKIRVIDLEIMYEIVHMKETLHKTARFTFDEDKYSGARKTCFVANARRFFRENIRKRIVDAELHDLRESLNVWRGNSMADFVQKERRNFLLYDIQQTFGDLIEDDVNYVDGRVQKILAEDKDERDKESAEGGQHWQHLQLVDHFPNLRL